MIKLHFKDEYPLVFDVDDWFKLRTKYRIIGQICGSTGVTPALPLALCPEESIMLIKNGIAKLVGICEHTQMSTKIEEYEKQMKKLCAEEDIELREARKNQINNVIDKIILGKRKKGLTEISANDIINEELTKLPELETKNMITVTYTQHPQYLIEPSNEIPTSTLLQLTTTTRCAIYEDLWKKGYYITSARKFGGDFLVYLGDPVAYHAAYIVKCVENVDHMQNISQIVLTGRLGNTVKKIYVLANLAANGTIKYISLNWKDL